MAITVRHLSAADHEQMVRWTLAFFADLKAQGDPYAKGAVIREAEIRRNMVLPFPDERLGLIALSDHLPAGYLTARLERPFVVESPIRAVGHVSHVYVAPPHRRQGVATALLDGAKTWFKEQGIAWMQLSWQPANQLADAAWRASGFTPFCIHGRKRIDRN